MSNSNADKMPPQSRDMMSSLARQSIVKAIHRLNNHLGAIIWHTNTLLRSKGASHPEITGIREMAMKSVSALEDLQRELMLHSDEADDVVDLSSIVLEQAILARHRETDKTRWQKCVFQLSPVWVCKDVATVIRAFLADLFRATAAADTVISIEASLADGQPALTVSATQSGRTVDLASLQTYKSTRLTDQLSRAATKVKVLASNSYRFHFTSPLSVQLPHDTALTKTNVTVQPASEKAPEKNGKLRVLIADDQPELLAMLGDWMVAKGHDVTTARDRETAVTIMRESAPFDLVTIDLNLPNEEDGLQTLKMAKKFQPGAYLVLTSGYRTIDKQWAAQIDADTMLWKPWTPKDWEAIISKVLSRDQSHR
jgi:CheY-like chemotaxis protein